MIIGWRSILSTMIIAVMLLSSGAAKADVLTFKLRSFSQYAVNVAFFSKNRKHGWPSLTTVYVISNYQVASYPLTCIEGESICYGASVKGNAKRYWGRSTDGKKACQSCCYTCKGKTTTPVINLNE